MEPLLHIGTIEYVSLPDDGIEHVPAKIDTGADNSSIWASNIHLRDGQLVFNFFAPGSAFYNETPVVTSAYRTTTVRNSFGHKEFRYKIKLRICIGDLAFRRWFSLADRSQNNYPILLGKNFLKNTFIVDVAQRYLASTEPSTNKILVLAAQSAKTKEFFKDVKKQNKLPLDYFCTGYGSLLYCIDNQFKTSVLNVADNDTDLADYSYTFFKSHSRNAELAASAAEYLHFRGSRFVDQELTKYVSASKLSESMKLACFGLNIPALISAKTPLLKDQYERIAHRLKVPFVLKETSSDRGENNYLISSEDEFQKILDEAPAEQTYMAQQYIENDGFYRIYVMGNTVCLAVLRTPYNQPDKMKAHLNKPHGSVNAKLVDLEDVPGELHEIALRAANCMDRQVAGVDILQDKHTGVWYVLEVNNAPQLRSGSFEDDKVQMIARFFDKELS